jgi:23S rRNA (adenine2503-C2)-methyltransferase
LIPVPKWSLAQIADYGLEFFKPGDRKVTLNFALSDKLHVDPEAIRRFFPPDVFFIKLTPINPTGKAVQNSLQSALEDITSTPALAARFAAAGYEVLYSIGELEENKIGSNCGQHIMHFKQSAVQIKDSYTYPLRGD